MRPLGVEIRAGVHTDECERVDGKFGGIAAHTGARVAAKADAGEVLVSPTVKDLVAGLGIEFEDRGAHTSSRVSLASGASTRWLRLSDGPAATRVQVARRRRRLTGQLLAADLVDELILTFAPTLVGRGPALADGEFPLRRFTLVELERYGENGARLHYERSSPTGSG